MTSFDFQDLFGIKLIEKPSHCKQNQSDHKFETLSYVDTKLKQFEHLDTKIEDFKLRNNQNSPDFLSEKNQLKNFGNLNKNKV